MFSKIKDVESYWGVVEAVDDAKLASRIKVRVETVYDEIPVEAIPWATPRYLDNQSHDLPAIGDRVQVKFMNNDKYFPTWYRIRQMTKNLSEDDYPSATVVTEKDLVRYELDGDLSIRWTKSEGLLLELTRDDTTSTIIIRNDNTVAMHNGQTDRWVHISNESISIGSETKSQQPAVVGDDNHEALNKLNDTIDALVTIMDSWLNKLSETAKSNPYTSLLAPVFKLYAKEMKLELNKLHKENNTFFPETLSEVATIDKT